MTHILEDDERNFGEGQESRHCWVSRFPTFPGGQVSSQIPLNSYLLAGQLATHRFRTLSPNSPVGQVDPQVWLLVSPYSPVGHVATHC